MSLEKAIEDLIAAVDDNTKALKAIAERVERADPVKSTGKDADAAPRARGRPRGSAKDADKAPTTTEIRKAFGEYLAVKEDDEYNVRREFVEAILSELGAEKISDASDKDMARAYVWLQQHKAGDRVNFDDNGEGDRGRDRDRGDGDRGRDRSRDDGDRGEPPRGRGGRDRSLV